MIRDFLAFRRMVRAMRNAPLPVGIAQMRGAEIRLMYEPRSSYDTRLVAAKLQGMPPPPREFGWEVSYWPVVGQPCISKRGATLAKALKNALAAPFPASLT